jgi:NAD(P)-dependent dehydrogenase (short-subunit alcohol dehydrogenase family)
MAGANTPLGIGRASAHQFAQNGAKAVYICDYNDSNLGTHKRELASLYPDVKVHTMKFDAADEKSVKAVVDHAIETYGRLDIFFANAGIIGQNKIFMDITEAAFLATLRTNVVRYGISANFAISY